MSAGRDDQVRGWMRARLDGLDGPGVAWRLDGRHRAGTLTAALAGEFVAEAWDLCPWPMSVLSRERWLALFRLAGFSDEFVPAPAPVEGLRLYRGSDPRGRLGLCWSASVDVGRWMASRFEVGLVWVADVEPWRMLARIDWAWEQQLVVDTTGLVPVELEGPDVVAGLDREVLLRRLDGRRDALLSGRGVVR